MADERYRLALLGPPSLRDPHGELVGFPAKAFALAALLDARADGRAARPVLAGLLYEDVGQTAAMVNLRQLLSRVQSRQNQLGIELFAFSKDEVRLVAETGGVALDVAMLRAVETLPDRQALDAFREGYGGDLLEGFEGKGEAFDAWLAGQRAEVRRRYLDFLRSGAANLGGREGERALRQILRFDAYSEDVWRDLLKLVRETVDLEAAERVFQEMTERFEADLGIAPGPETGRLMEILRGRGSVRGAEASYVRPAEALLRGPAPDGGSAATPVPRLCILMPPAEPGLDEHAGLVGSLIEDITLGLCRLRSLAVIAPHTAWQLAGDGAAPLGQLQLDYVVETSLRSSSTGPRIYVKLVRMSDRVIISGDVYELSDSYLGHHDRLTKMIVQALADGLERAEGERFLTSARPDAYQWLLQGRQHSRVLDLPHVRRARKAFGQAVECDPSFVPGLSGKARTLILEWLLLAQTDRNLLIQAQSIAQHAITLDPFSGEALRDYAGSTLLLGGMDEAKEGFSKAERLTPHHADILADHANALTHCSEMELALGKIERAIGLNPIPPDDYLWTAGGALFFLNDFEGALSYLKRMKRQEPAFRLTAACLAMQGQRREAAYFVARALEDQPNFLIQDWVATIPLRSKQHIQQYTHALAQAGFR
ncbi:BTAD domain-containing putative transcriptional regulator [Aureimonas sp. ME7]|uniref:BTAD domain-containing putative transcriptional regulator n=1 Tax=Aureimonas sp. ME7 TaxID=2744252 RepID=UPI0015F38F72|nr:BTAD domain-containing putative transcriptional regulator [Aureimonas sp. ME7]